MTHDANQLEAGRHRPAGMKGRAPCTSTTSCPVACSHCRLPVPAGLVNPGSDVHFCCHGCETAYQVIHSCGLDAFYRVLERADATATPPKSGGRGGRAGRGYAEFDDPTFERLYVRPGEGGRRSIELFLEGVHCAACVWLVERLPRLVAGVSEARLDLRRASVRIEYDAGAVALSRIARTLDSLGYAPHPARGRSVAEARRREDRRMLVRLAVAGACAGNIMLLFIAMYAGMFEGIERGHDQLFRWVAMGLNTLCLAWPGMVFARSAWASLRARQVHLDVPITLGLYLGGAWGMWKTIAGEGDLYFDSISALIFFLLIGRYIQQRQQRFASDAVELLFSLTPAVAHRVNDAGDAEDVATQSLAPGDTVEVRAGETVPADGVVVRGDSRIESAMLTGESRPLSVGVGGAVSAGCVNLSAPLRVRVQAVGEQSRLGKLMRMVEEAAQRRAAIVRLADRWGRWLLWALLALAGVTLALWWSASPAAALDRTAALLIATCPCGLGLATPLAMTVAIGGAARRGILIKGGDVLQALAQPGTRGRIVLDKTGTLTIGRLSLVTFYGDRAVRSMLAALEGGSAHPVAQALVRDLSAGEPAGDRSLGGGPEVLHFREHPSRGVEGLIRDNERQHRVAAGTRSLMDSLKVQVSSGMEHAAGDALGNGHSPVYVALDGECVAVAGLGDPVRPEAPAAIAALRRAGWHVSILSGDHPEIVQGVARQVGVAPDDARGGASPEDKLFAIQVLAAQGPAVMIGDGVNDAAALAAATVGVAVRGGAEASLSAADVSLAREGLGPVVELLDGARAIMRSIHFTIATSLGYNVLAAGLSMAGLISPLLAAFIMPASSFTVVAICVRSRAFRGPARVRFRAGDPGGEPAAGDAPSPATLPRERTLQGALA